MASSSVPNQPYHHGNLRVALVDAGLELARQGGADAVVLREATRRVGVTAAAAYRHFDNREALLDAVSEAARKRMVAHITGLMNEVGDGPPHEVLARRLNACGNGYVTFALNEPGWFDIAFHSFATGQTDVDQSINPFAHLSSTMDQLVAAGVLTAERRKGVQVMCWSIVHGFVHLVLKGPLGALPREELRGIGDLMQQEMALFVRSAMSGGPRPPLSPGENTAAEPAHRGLDRTETGRVDPA